MLRLLVAAVTGLACAIAWLALAFFSVTLHGPLHSMGDFAFAPVVGLLRIFPEAPGWVFGHQGEGVHHLFELMAFVGFWTAVFGAAVAQVVAVLRRRKGESGSRSAKAR